MFNKFKFTEDVSCRYEKTVDGEYAGHGNLKVKKDDVATGEIITKGDKKYFVFNAKAYGVDQLVEVPEKYVKKEFPWLILAIAVAALGVAAYFGFRKKK